MKQKMFLKFLLIPSICLLFLVSCQDNSTTAKADENPKEVAEDSNEAKLSDKQEDNSQFLVDAYSGGLYEVQSSEGAQKMSGTKEIKNLAATMVSAHTKMNGMIKDLAGKKQITLPAALTEKQMDKMKECSEKKGAEFDKAYLDDLENGHKDMISLLEKAADKSTDADIKSWASSSLPDIKNHLAMVQAAQEKNKK